MKIFAERLKELRQEKHLNQKEFAKLVDISSGIISYYEQDKVDPSLENLVKIAKFFDCSIDYLAGLEDFY